MNRDSFLFYRSYYEAIKNLPDSTKLEVYNAVMEYGLYGNEIELHDEFARSIFTLIKPVLETNNKRFKSGKSGGRPRKEKPMVLKNENQSKTYGFENSGKNENLRHLMIKDISSDEDIGYRIEDKDISSDEDDIYLECIKIHSCPPCPADASGSNPKDSDLPTADAETAPNEPEENPSPPGSAPPPSPRIDYNAIMQKFNTALAGKIPRIEKMTDARKRAVNARVKDFGPESVDKVISIVAASDFLHGRNKSDWCADFDWIFRPANYAKILEGNYDNKKKKGSYKNSDYWGGQTE